MTLTARTRKWLGLWIACACLASGWPRQARAERQLGGFFVSFQPWGLQRYLTTAPHVPFQWHVLADIDFDLIDAPERNLSDGLFAWEAAVTVPASIVVQQRQLHPGSAYNFGGPDNYIVGTGTCVATQPGPRVLVSYTGLLLDAAAHDLRIALQPADPSSFEDAGTGPAPGWNDCGPDFGELHTAHWTWESSGWAEVNPSHQPGGVFGVIVSPAVGKAGQTIEVPIQLQVLTEGPGGAATVGAVTLNLDWNSAMGRVRDVSLGPLAQGLAFDWSEYGGTVNVYIQRSPSHPSVVFPQGSSCACASTSVTNWGDSLSTSSPRRSRRTARRGWPRRSRSEEASRSTAKRVTCDWINASMPRMR